MNTLCVCGKRIEYYKICEAYTSSPNTKRFQDESAEINENHHRRIPNGSFKIAKVSRASIVATFSHTSLNPFLP